MSEADVNPPNSETIGCKDKLNGYLRSPKFKLYCSYALSSCGDRMWTFAVSLALVKISIDLRLAAISMAINGLTVLFFGAAVGRWIDRTPRFRAASIILAANNISVAISAALLVLLLYLDAMWDEWAKTLLIVASIVFGAVSLLAGTGSNIIVSKDWVVEMCHGNQEKLANMNAMLVRIDQTSMIVSPIIAGQLMTSINLAVGCMFIAGWNVCSFGLELYLLWLIYAKTPQLKRPHESNISPVETTANEALIREPDSNEELQSREAYERPSCCQRWYLWLKSGTEAWKSYYHHQIFPAAFGLALLYLTVLGLDGITTGFAYAQGLSENILAIVRAAGALLGIAGTFVFPKLRKLVGLHRSGLISSTLQISCLSLCVISIWLPGSPFDLAGYFNVQSSANGTAINGSLAVMNMNVTSTDGQHLSTCSIWTFLTGVCLARFGLWMLDLVITQIMQENIVESERGAINGVQNALQESMDMLKSFLVIALPDPKTFGLLTIISFGAVIGGFCSYSVYSRRVRGHLFHFSQLKTCVYAKEPVTLVIPKTPDQGEFDQIERF